MRLRFSRPGSKLNTGAIKSLVMLLVGILMGAVQGVTGIGMQPGTASASGFLLGYAADRQAALATVAAAAASVSALAGYWWGGYIIAAPTYVLVAVCAFCGALPFVRQAADASFGLGRRTAHRLVIIGATVLLASIINSVYRPPVSLANPTSWSLLIAVGALAAVSGSATAIYQLSAGVALVPLLVLVGGFSIQSVIAGSLFTIAVAATLPAVAYIARGFAAGREFAAYTFGSGLAGFGAGRLLAALYGNTHLLTAMYAVTAMFMSSWAITRAQPPEVGKV